MLRRWRTPRIKLSLVDVEGAMSGPMRDQFEMENAIGRSGLGAKAGSGAERFDVQTGGLLESGIAAFALEREKAILSGGDSALDVVEKTLAATLVPATVAFYDRMFGGDPEQNENGQSDPEDD